MKSYIVLILTGILAGCLNTAGEAGAAESAGTFFDTLSGAGLPYAGILGGACGVLAEFIRGRKEKKTLLAQGGAVYDSVDEYLSSLSEADKAAAKAFMNKALVAAVGAKKADKAVKTLKVGKEISKKLSK
jgi:hypothetical protein